jgi:hypothetical protein
VPEEPKFDFRKHFKMIRQEHFQNCRLRTVAYQVKTASIHERMSEIDEVDSESKGSFNGFQQDNGFKRALQNISIKKEPDAEIL